MISIKVAKCRLQMTKSRKCFVWMAYLYSKNLPIKVYDCSTEGFISVYYRVFQTNAMHTRKSLQNYFSKTYIQRKKLDAQFSVS